MNGAANAADAPFSSKTATSSTTATDERPQPHPLTRGAVLTGRGIGPCIFVCVRRRRSVLDDPFRASAPRRHREPGAPCASDPALARLCPDFIDATVPKSQPHQTDCGTATPD